MADYPEIDEKYYLELLYDYRSDGFKKVGRNLKTASFIIIVVGALDLNLNQLKVLGLNLGGNADSSKLEWLGIALIIYWLVFFISYFRADKELQKERSYQFEKEIGNFRNLVKEAEERKVDDRKNSRQISRPQDDVILLQIPKILEKYEKQKNRTNAANVWSEVIRVSEFAIPLMLAIAATLILIF